MAKRKQKKKATRKPRGGAPLPKSVQALLKYLSGSSTGIGGGGVSSAPTAAQQFQAAAPPPPPQPAGVVRKPRAKKATASAPVPSPLQAIAPQAAAQTTVIQLPTAAAPTAPAPETQREIATLRQTAKQQEGAIRELKSVVQQQGTEQLFRSMREGLTRPLGSLPSQQPSYIGGPPSAPSWAGRSSSASSSSLSSETEGRFDFMMRGRQSMRGSEGGGETAFVSARQSVASETPSVQTIAGFLEEESAGLGEYIGGQYVQSAANPAIPEKRMGRGRPAKSEEEKKATRAAAAQRRKEATRAESLAQLSSLGSVSSESSNPFSFIARGRSKGKAPMIFSQAQQSGADPSTTIRAMVAGGGAAVPQAGEGLSLGEIVAQNKTAKAKGKKK